MSAARSNGSTETRPRNTVYGKVVLTDPSIGVPDLLVVLYDIDPETKPEENIASDAFAQLGDRIGSVLTGPDGAFSLTFEDGEFRIRDAQEKRPDLLLMVLAAELVGKPLRERILFVSPVRQNAGRLESYLILLRAEDLKRVGLPTPATPVTPGVASGDEELDLIEAKLSAGKRFFDRKAEILRQHVEVAHEQYAQERTATFSVNVKEELSRVPKSLRDQHFVAEGESVFSKVLSKTTAQVDKAFNTALPDQRASSGGFVYLSQAQIAEYAQYLQGDEYVLPPDVLQAQILPNLFGSGHPGSGGGKPVKPSNDFLMDNPQVRLCTRLVKGDISCVGHDHDEGGNPIPSPPDVTTPTPPAPLPPPAQAADVFGYIARMMRFATSPEGVLNVGVEDNSLPDQQQIADHIAGLRLSKGPADVPAYFDFHSLHIAFEHVWKEATDAGVLAQGEALYDQAVAVGKRPTGLMGILQELKSVKRFLKNDPQKEQSGPPVEVIFEFPEAVELWSKMVSNEQTALIRTTRAMLGKYEQSDNGDNKVWSNYLSGKTTKVPFLNKEHLLDNGAYELIAAIRQKGLQLLDVVRERVEKAGELKEDLDNYRSAEALAEELERKLKERYSFTYFAANAQERSVNFGVLLTYRQKWEPVGYSAGELVWSVPLAPKEVRKYSKRTVVKKKRSQKEIEDNLRIIKTDTADTSRAESVIVSKALNKSSFGMNTSTTFEIPVGAMKIGNTINTNFATEAQRESSQTKKDFREAVLKATQEYKSERKVEISSELTQESEETESGEISNPNDELTVTYLFYELQRQFRVNEQLHRLRPVVLVAQEMPAPHEIDDDWILRHDWILKRALMDDSFMPAFECILSVRGEVLMLAELERTVLEQRKIVKDLRQNVRFFTDETGRMSRLMQAAINKQADVVEDRDFWDGIPLLGSHLNSLESSIKGVGSMLGFGEGDDPKEAGRIRREGVKDAYERADRERRELMGRLEHETSVMNGLTKEVAEKRKLINEKRILIVRLQNHLKDHILHYMQAIWSYEHPDQRYFRLFNTKVPQLRAPAAGYNLRIKARAEASVALDAIVNINRSGAARLVRHPFHTQPQNITVEEKTLSEVAELDNLLGFKGNYMIFPLLKSNVLTDFMMAPYVDSEFGLLDPDAPGNWTLEEFQQLYCCLKEKMTEPEFAEIEPALQDFYKQLLMDPLRPGELISVPTGSLFIEALPGAHPLLENFKALHRAVDVKKVQAEVRKAELENIRYAARILAGQHGDPDVDKKIIVEGTDITVTPDT